MKRLVTTILLVGLIALVGIIIIGVRVSSEEPLFADDDSFDLKGALFRLSAEFKNFDGSETFTNATVPQNPVPGEGGILAYRKEIYVPKEATLYVTISTTGDTHEGAASWFSCVVDDETDKKNDTTDTHEKASEMFCNPGAGGAAGVPGGWVALLKLPAPNEGADNCDDGNGGAGDCHDNNIYYTWCTNVKKGDHTVDIRLASSDEGEYVFFETAHFYIDATEKTKDTCVQTDPKYYDYEGSNPHE
jgi:hypothetical protein